jgi:hypothetical protein
MTDHHALLLPENLSPTRSGPGTSGRQALGTLTLLARRPMVTSTFPEIYPKYFDTKRQWFL